MKYTAKSIKDIKNDERYTHSQTIGVFADDKQIGEYQRNYSTLMNTFHAFKSRGKDLALYSKRYDLTRIMSLPDCIDIGGEESTPHGFCPVDFYVPSYVIHEDRYLDKDKKEVVFQFWNFDGEDEHIDEGKVISEQLSTPFGFVAGCLWGDDTSWKVQYLDLKDAASGKLIRDDRFGYVELAHNQTLREAVRMRDFDEIGSFNINISTRFSTKKKDKDE